jgi:hypothetical protein
MLSKIESVTVKSKSIVDAEKRVIRKASMEVARAVQDAVRVLRIMIFLHSAKDFSSVLRLYGMEDSSGTEWKTAEKMSYFFNEKNEA